MNPTPATHHRRRAGDVLDGIQFALTELNSVDMPKAVGANFETAGREYLQMWAEKGFSITMCHPYADCFTGTRMSPADAVMYTITNSVSNVLLQRVAPPNGTAPGASAAGGTAESSGHDDASASDPTGALLDTGAVSVVAVGGDEHVAVPREAYGFATAAVHATAPSAGVASAVTAGAADTSSSSANATDVRKPGAAGVAQDVQAEERPPPHGFPKVWLPRLPPAEVPADGADLQGPLRPDIDCVLERDSNLTRASRLLLSLLPCL